MNIEIMVINFNFRNKYCFFVKSYRSFNGQKFL